MIVAPAAYLVDRVVGEPPAPIHPVAWFGRAMTAYEHRWYDDSRPAGLVHAAVGVSIAIGAGHLLSRLLGARMAGVVASSLCIAGRMLEREASGVAASLDVGDLVGARRKVARLVGRATDDLDESEVARAVVETVAENTVDAVVASMWWATIGGAPGVLAHRAVNTMDAMVGHRTPRHGRYGWTVARLDDAMNFIPARVAMLVVMIVRPRRAAEVITTVRRDAHRHPSPNGGVVEASFAAALGVELGGCNRYGDVVDDRGRLGRGRPVSADDIEAAVELAGHGSLAAGLMIAGGALAVRWAVRE